MLNKLDKSNNTHLGTKAPCKMNDSQSRAENVQDEPKEKTTGDLSKGHNRLKGAPTRQRQSNLTIRGHRANT